MRAAISCVRKHCALCEKVLALAADNQALVQKKELRAICPRCMNEHFGSETEFRGMVGGKEYSNPLEALRAATLLVRRN